MKFCMVRLYTHSKNVLRTYHNATHYLRFWGHIREQSRQKNLCLYGAYILNETALHKNLNYC